MPTWGVTMLQNIFDKAVAYERENSVSNPAHAICASKLPVHSVEHENLLLEEGGVARSCSDGRSRVTTPVCCRGGACVGHDKQIMGSDASGGRSGDDSAESALFAAEDDVPFDVLLSAPCAIVVDDLRRRPLALSAAQVAANKAETATLTLSDLARCDVAEKWCAPEEINRGTGAKGALTNAVGGGASPFLQRSAIQKLVDRATPLRDSSRGAARGGDEGGELAVRPACAGLGPGRDPAFDELRRLVQLSAKGGVDEATSARRLGKALAGVRVSVQA